MKLTELSPRYEPKLLEPAILALWKANKIYERAVKKSKAGRPFYFLDGPPYTTGRIHIGHAWNKALKDALMRYKRMAGFAVFDRPGFDMHGLPIELEVEKAMGIKLKREITERIGIARFVRACEAFAKKQMEPMIADFVRMGAWFAWSDPYMTLTNNYIEAVWWALARANENGLLYRGERAMSWCPRCATALAKHELVYKSIRERSIYVKFKLRGREKEFLIVWTTTPWTIPYNLAIMVNPELDYVRVRAEGESWIVAKALVGSLSAVTGKPLEIIEELKGDTLDGLAYEHPLEEELPIIAELRKMHKKVHTVVLSKEYVSAAEGTGLVHCAPGCGPEDYEVGRRYGLPAFNEVDEDGRFGARMGPFAGLVARIDDAKFIEALGSKKAVIASTEITHDYAHCWRCASAIVYRTTQQWFLAVEGLRQRMLAENSRIAWLPNWAGSRWFASWLAELGDWCISRQRFWGIPLPIWICEACGSHTVVESVDELRKLAGKKPKELHRPWIDELKLKCGSCGGQSARVPDVLDVWLDSGAAPWAVLEDRARYQSAVAELIIEGKDQIRGWFNSLLALSMVSRGIASYKAVYMHGMVMDALGRKMSKSLKNIISPDEVIQSYGADTMRYYMIGAANPGLDMNYNFEDMKQKFRNLQLLWNLSRFLVDHCDANGYRRLPKLKQNALGPEERWMLSRLHSTIVHVTALFEQHKLNETPAAIESLFTSVSRDYLQMVREKASTGSDAEKESVAALLGEVLVGVLKLFAPIAPFITEGIWQALAARFDLKPAYIHLCDWPKAERGAIDKALEGQFALAIRVLGALLAGRDKAGLSLRWPLNSAIIVTKDSAVSSAVTTLAGLLSRSANIKELKVLPELGYRKRLKADYAKLAPEFGEAAPKIIAQLAIVSPESVLASFESKGFFRLKVDSKDYDIKPEHLMVGYELPLNIVESLFKGGAVYLDTTSTPELEAEGFARELMRRIQAMRKEAGLQKKDRIELCLRVPRELLELLKQHHAAIKARTGAVRLEIVAEVGPKGYALLRKESIKGKEFEIGLSPLHPKSS